MKAARRYFLVPLFLFPVLFFTILTTAAQAQAGRRGRRRHGASVAGDYGAVAAEVAANFMSPPTSMGRSRRSRAGTARTRRRCGRGSRAIWTGCRRTGCSSSTCRPGGGSAGRAGVSFAGAYGPGEVHRGELAKRNMRMWIQDESDYPSGFAGGYISERYPELGMQDIVADISVHVAPGQTLQMPVPQDTLAIWATDGPRRPPLPGGGQRGGFDAKLVGGIAGRVLTVAPNACLLQTPPRKALPVVRWAPPTSE